MTKKMTTITYRIRVHNDFSEPYWGTTGSPEKSPIVNHVNYEEYSVDNDKQAFKKIIDDTLDAPKKPLTEKNVRQDFDANREQKMSNACVDAVKKYYNGRLKLKKKIITDLGKIDLSKLSKSSSIKLKYNVPFEMNYFSCIDNDPCNGLVKMNCAFIEIEVSKW